jgi:hypothetical protein
MGSCHTVPEQECQLAKPSTFKCSLCKCDLDESHAFTCAICKLVVCLSCHQYDDVAVYNVSSLCNACMLACHAARTCSRYAPQKTVL